MGIDEMGSRRSGMTPYVLLAVVSLSFQSLNAHANYSHALTDTMSINKYIGLIIYDLR